MITTDPFMTYVFPALCFLCGAAVVLIMFSPSIKRLVKKHQRTSNDLMAARTLISALQRENEELYYAAQHNSQVATNAIVRAADELANQLLGEVEPWEKDPDAWKDEQ